MIELWVNTYLTWSITEGLSSTEFYIRFRNLNHPYFSYLKEDKDKQDCFNHLFYWCLNANTKVIKTVFYLKAIGYKGKYETDQSALTAGISQVTLVNIGQFYPS